MKEFTVTYKREDWEESAYEMIEAETAEEAVELYKQFMIDNLDISQHDESELERYDVWCNE